MAEIVELELTGVAAGGEAVGRHPETGKIVFIADAVPGERVQVVIDEDRNRWQRGRLLAVLEASPYRVAPPCPYFGPPQPVALPDGTVLNPDSQPRCSGCRWQHIAYERQLELKRAIVVEQLQRLGQVGAARRGGEPLSDLPWVEDVIALADLQSAHQNAVLDYGYLTQVTFRLDRQGRLCLAGRHGELLPIDACLLFHPQLADLHQAFRLDQETGAGSEAVLSSVNLAVGGTGSQLVDGQDGMMVLESTGEQMPELELDLPVNVLLRHPSPSGEDITPLVGDLGYQVAVGERRLVTYPAPVGQSFFWPHLTGNEALAILAGEMLAVQPFEGLLDLWAGIGIGAVTLAGQVGTILAVEEDPLAMAALELNVVGLENVATFWGNPARILPTLSTQGHQAGAALVQIREGQIGAKLMAQIGSLGVRRVAVLTDNVAGLARSLAPLREVGFELVRVQPVDLAPQRDTVTLIALLTQILP